MPKISERPPAGPLAGTEQIPIVQSGTTVRASATGIANTATSVELENAGLKIQDTDASHVLTVKPGSNLTQARTLSVFTGDADRSVSLGGDVVLGGVQELTDDGAVSLATQTTFITSDADGTALTLADGTSGQVKILVMVADGGGNAVLTPANYGNGTTITFDDVGDSATLVFRTGNWWLVGTPTATSA